MITWGYATIGRQKWLSDQLWIQAYFLLKSSLYEPLWQQWGKVDIDLFVRADFRILLQNTLPQNFLERREVATKEPLFSCGDVQSL